MRQISTVKAMLLAVFSTLALPANAQDISWKLPSMKPGDYVSVRQVEKGNRRTQHHLLRGKSGRTFIIDTYEGKKPQGKPISTTTVDKDGNYLSWQNQHGYSIKYKPHDCTRTLGRCTYTQVDSNNEKLKRLRVTTLVEGGFTYVEYDEDGNWVVKGKTELDHLGSGGDGFVQNVEGRKAKFRLLGSSYD